MRFQAKRVVGFVVFAWAVIACVAVKRSAHSGTPAHSAVGPHGPDRAAEASGALAPLEPAGGARPAISLTASDGTGLELVSVTASSVVEDPLAFTELRLVFRNPDNRVLEGRFEVALPPRASVSRFAMRLGDRWQEGEVVEKQRARRVYEDFLHRKQDPALLEQGAGNAFSARVFPIGAREVKELVLSYSQELSGIEAPLVPLAGIGRLSRLDAAVHFPGNPARDTRLTLRDRAPNGDLKIKRKERRRRGALRNGNLVVASLQAPAISERDELDGALMLVDTSASRALDFALQTNLVAELSARMARRRPGSRVAVVAFDQTQDLLFDGPASGVRAALRAKLRRRGALGATDIGGALEKAGPLAKARGLRRVVLVGDGMPTAGQSEQPALTRSIERLRHSGVQRIDAIAVGGLRDESILHKLVTSSLPRAGVVVDARTSFDELERRLTTRAHRELAVTVAGAAWQFPKKLSGVQSGDEVLVFAEIDPDKPFYVALSGEPLSEVPTRPAARPLVERAWAKAKIDSLLADGEPTEALRSTIVSLSTRHRVVSPFTALLVLETEWDYQRYAIDRAALSDIMTIVDGRFGVVQRGAPAKRTERLPGTARTEGDADPQPHSQRMWSEAISESFGAGGLGLSGTGEGGGAKEEDKREPVTESIGTVGHGAGRGRLGTRHAFRAPKIRMGATAVSGRLPPEAIQRIVRQNYGRFRACYERGLLRNPRLLGRITARFKIRGDGSVENVENGGSSLPDPEVVRCVLDAFGALSFPRPESGTVTVVYPLLFSPDDAAGQSARRAATANETGNPPERQQLKAAPNPIPAPQTPPAARQPEREWPHSASPYTGVYGEVMDALAREERALALSAARKFRAASPGDVMGLLALGKALEANNAPALAARAYGSVIDLFPQRVDLRRYAAVELEQLATPNALHLARDSYEKALADRPDHVTTYRLLAYALSQARDHRRAFETLEAALGKLGERPRPGVDRIVREDLGLIAAQWIKAEPTAAAKIRNRLARAGSQLEERPSLRFILSWETDANDVDLHIYDDRGGHAYYASQDLASGGTLYADVTSGYGPEVFTVRGSTRAKRYNLQAHYFARGPMGFGMGSVQIVDHDGRGTLRVEKRPFVVMMDQAYADLGTYSPS